MDMRAFLYGNGFVPLGAVKVINSAIHPLPFFLLPVVMAKGCSFSVSFAEQQWTYSLIRMRIKEEVRRWRRVWMREGLEKVNGITKSSSSSYSQLNLHPGPSVHCVSSPISISICGHSHGPQVSTQLLPNVILILEAIDFLMEFRLERFVSLFWGCAKGHFVPLLPHIVYYGCVARRWGGQSVSQSKRTTIVNSW